ncbi:hypothetical protein CLOACE_01150 [Clostridium acetireducens DSM 10703]|uniref:4-hydroxy-3-methylbut-2-enyl diphosphate reductase n=1 Tax=Clostridium acetireducens DSM 10703 TaxID=1121290 RepID=A0A1E8F294_9CLOT|nr:bifunctional 4-hydroxy-3-methylbut-2-enyl diphosphate reductase/30S ribosomal protein S1 [Clostridium acetireducens]OFI07767.1 hypothetical protein CLOACE_01150 [Clostridium acetireducens DSM 10703]
MNITLAEKAGFCFGVKRAVDTALNTKKKYNTKIYTLGPLIHNNDAVNYLKDNNIYPIEMDKLDTLKEGDIVIIRSHGVSYQTLEMLKNKKLTIVNATCPFVSNIQQIVKKYYDLKYKIVIVGDKFHPEVIGINGWCNNEAIISKNGDNISLKNLNKICVVCQTTEKKENWEKVLCKIVKTSKEIVAFNTICSATDERQLAASILSKKSDLMVVIGGKNSSNTTKLYEICKDNCSNTIHIENAKEIPKYIKNYNNINQVGITAGASTPDWIIKEAILKMNNENNQELTEQQKYMEEYMNENEISIVVGKTISGEVIQLDDNSALIDIKDKKEALLPLKEITKEPDAKISDLVNVGDKVEAKIIKRRNENGQVVLSIIELKREEINKKREEVYKELKEALDNKTTIEVEVTKVVNGGLVSNYKDVRVFIPASHIELSHVDDLELYLNKKLNVKIIELVIGKKFNRIVASRRSILKSEKLEKEKAAWDCIQKDTIVEGEVKRLTNFGAFVDINGVDGLLHVSEISWGRVEKPEDVLEIGQKIKVYIIDVDKENRKLSLSIKKATENPWNNVDIKYPLGNIVLGKVVRFANFGAFVELEPGVDALVHISEISSDRINKPSDVLKVGQQIKAKIIDVNKEDKKIGLSIKEVASIE